MPLKAADLDRYLRLQRPTFERFYGDLGVTRIITPSADRRAIRAATRHLPGIKVLDERMVVPELLLRRWISAHTSNWYIQQLVKLAAVARCRAPFVLVLDADVFAVQDVTDRDLVVDGRALRPTTPASAHPDWIAWAAGVLDLAPLDYSAKVTPGVLAPEAVRLLAQHIQRTVVPTGRLVRTAARIPGVRTLIPSWRTRLLGALPWTEYQLYDTYLVRSGRFEQFHRYTTDPVFTGNSVWEIAAFGDWHAGPSRAGAEYFFSVVQSSTGVAVETVEAKLEAAGLLP
jgi:hypothetical protein